MTPRTPATDLSVTITIRQASARDERALRRLAALDSAEVPHEPLLLAEVGGTARAALSLADGTSIADPFAPTSDILALLRERARGVGAGRRRRLKVRRARRRESITVRHT